MFFSRIAASSVLLRVAQFLMSFDCSFVSESCGFRKSSWSPLVVELVGADDSWGDLVVALWLSSDASVPG